MTINQCVMQGFAIVGTGYELAPQVAMVLALPVLQAKEAKDTKKKCCKKYKDGKACKRCPRNS